MLHNAAVMFTPQDVPAQAPAPVPVPLDAASDVVQQLESLTWVDHTALGVLLVFFVLGLFKGLIWQVSRIAILVAAYVVSGRYGAELADVLAGATKTPPALAPVPPGDAVAGGAGEGAVAVDAALPTDTTIYLAYVLLFLAVLVVLSLVAMLLQKLATKAGLGFFDRLGGGALGVATGSCVVLFFLSVVHMFFRDSQVAAAADASRSMKLSVRAIELLGDRVPDELRAVFDLAPLRSPSLPAPPTLPLPQLPPAPLDGAGPGTPPVPNAPANR
jgi:uncharacterized membrane protein required for colicin V production